MCVCVCVCARKEYLCVAVKKMVAMEKLPLSCQPPSISVAKYHMIIMRVTWLSHEHHMIKLNQSFSAHVPLLGRILHQMQAVSPHTVADAGLLPQESIAGGSRSSVDVSKISTFNCL